MRHVGHMVGSTATRWAVELGHCSGSAVDEVEEEGEEERGEEKEGQGIQAVVWGQGQPQR